MEQGKVNVESGSEGDRCPQHRRKDNGRVAEDHGKDKPQKDGMQHGVVTRPVHDPTE